MRVPGLFNVCRVSTSCREVDASRLHARKVVWEFGASVMQLETCCICFLDSAPYILETPDSISKVSNNFDIPGKT